MLTNLRNKPMALTTARQPASGRAEPGTQEPSLSADESDSSGGQSLPRRLSLVLSASGAEGAASSSGPRQGGWGDLKEEGSSADTKPTPLQAQSGLWVPGPSLQPGCRAWFSYFQTSQIHGGSAGMKDRTQGTNWNKSSE